MTFASTSFYVKQDLIDIELSVAEQTKKTFMSEDEKCQGLKERDMTQGNSEQRASARNNYSAVN